MVENKNQESSAEERIMQAAVNIFTRKGLDGARMQDIADEAQVNKAMVHYYYRNKKNLFTTIFEKKIKELFSAFSIILQGESTFEEKIRAFVAKEIEMISGFPSLPLFVMNEAAKNPKMLHEIFEEGGPRMLKSLFKILVEKEVEAGRIRAIEYDQLLINIMGLCIYPFVAKPILQFILEKDESQFQQMLEYRKSSVADLILNDILIKH
jgi:AcrR family transcriptional regulator